MRGTFAVVLAAGVAAAVGLSMASRGAGESPPVDASAVTSADPPPEASAATRPTEADSPPSLVARVDDLLRKGDATAAARVLLSAEPKEFRADFVRDRAFRSADALVVAADVAPSAAASSLRMDARRLYAAVYCCDSSTADEMTRAFDGCGRLHQALLFGNGAPDELVLRHRVAAGESVWGLAKGPWRQRGVTVPAGFVLHVNGVSDPRRIRAGQTLRVPLESLRVLVRKSRFELGVLLGGAPIGRFTVAIGADASTPVGTFRIRDKIKNPDWYYHGRRIPFGDPQNIIGTRWIGLTGAAVIDGIGIHGTSDPSSIGKAVSMGCVRMQDADVEKLFEWVDAGTEVEIRD